MDGPWSQYAQPAASDAPASPPAGPWTQYAAATPKPDASAPDNPLMSDFPTYAAPAPAEPAPGDAAVERIGQAAGNAFMTTPTILTPAAEDAVNKGGPIGRYITNPAIHAVDVVHGAINAAGGGIAQTLMEVFGEKGGRDALAFLSALPMAPEANQLSAMRANGPAAQTAAPAAAANPQFVSERFAPDVSELDSRNAIQTLIQHDLNENPSIPGAAADRGAANQGAAAVAKIGSATDIDGAIAAASEAAQAPSYTPVTATQVAARDGVPIMEAWNRARAENAAGGAAGDNTAAVGAPGIYGGAPDATTGPFEQPAANVNSPTDFRSVGAAASRDNTPQSQIELSPTDMKANRYQGEMNEILAPPAAGDNTVYVKGSFPTLAERSGDPELSQQENLLRQRNPAAFVGEGKPLTENNNARVAEFDNQTPSRTALTMMRDQRNSQWEADSNGILPTAKPVDFTPAMDWVEGQLNDPKIQENDAVRGVLQDFRERLLADDGTLKDDPAAAWGIHDNIQNQLAKAKDPLNATGAEKFAFNELTQAKAHVDAALNVATDGKFQNAVDNYAQASQAINAGEELEAFRPKLTNASGTIMADRFHKFVVDLAQRRGDPGIDPAMNISDETMQSLINIDKDLKRAGLIKLGAAAGSPTNLLGALAENLGMGAAHSALSAIPVAGPILKAGADYLGQRRLQAMTAKHLAPPEGGYVYPEPETSHMSDLAAQHAQDRMGIGFKE